MMRGEIVKCWPTFSPEIIRLNTHLPPRFWHTALVIFDVLVLVHFPSATCTTELGARSLGWEGLWISVHGCLHLTALLHRVWRAPECDFQAR